MKGLVFRSFSDVSTKVSKYEGITNDEKVVCVSFVDGSCDIGIGNDKIEALRNRREQFNLPEGGDYLSQNKLFSIMSWKVN